MTPEEFLDELELKMERLKKQPHPTPEQVEIQMAASIAVRKKLKETAKVGSLTSLEHLGDTFKCVNSSMLSVSAMYSDICKNK